MFEWLIKLTKGADGQDAYLTCFRQKDMVTRFFGRYVEKKLKTDCKYLVLKIHPDKAVDIDSMDNVTESEAWASLTIAANEVGKDCGIKTSFVFER